jgi:hypothetical protein
MNTYEIKQQNRKDRYQNRAAALSTKATQMHDAGMKTLKIAQIKEAYWKIRNSWTYNHKLLILTLSLAVVVIIQDFPTELIPRNVAIAYTAEKQVTDADLLVHWVENRKIAIYNDNYEDNMREAEIMALTEANARLMELGQLDPKGKYKQFKQVLEALENGDY